MSACLLAAVLAAVLTAFNQHLWASPAHPPTSLSPWKPGNYDVCMVAAGVLSPSNDSVLWNVARNIWLKHLKSTSACEILSRCWRLWRAWGKETERGYLCFCRLFSIDSPVSHKQNEAFCLSVDVSLGLSVFARVSFSSQACVLEALFIAFFSLPRWGLQVPIVIYTGLHFFFPQKLQGYKHVRVRASTSMVSCQETSTKCQWRIVGSSQSHYNSQGYSASWILQSVERIAGSFIYIIQEGNALLWKPPVLVLGTCRLHRVISQRKLGSSLGVLSLHLEKHLRMDSNGSPRTT